MVSKYRQVMPTAMLSDEPVFATWLEINNVRFWEVKATSIIEGLTMIEFTKHPQTEGNISE